MSTKTDVTDELVDRQVQEEAIGLLMAAGPFPVLLRQAHDVAGELLEKRGGRLLARGLLAEIEAEVNAARFYGITLPVEDLLEPGLKLVRVLSHGDDTSTRRYLNEALLQPREDPTVPTDKEEALALMLGLVVVQLALVNEEFTTDG